VHSSMREYVHTCAMRPAKSCVFVHVRVHVCACMRRQSMVKLAVSMKASWRFDSLSPAL